MSGESPSPSPARWRILGVTAQGQRHRELGAPNQDALNLWPEPTGSHEAVIMAVADGHGSSVCFRSGSGSRLAVASALEILRPIIDRHDQLPLKSVKRAAQDWELSRALVCQWRSRVQDHLDQAPLSDEERNGLEHGFDSLSDRDKQRRLWQAYGSTLLVAIVTPRFILPLQIGDGDVLVVGDNGTVCRPLPADDRLVANETTSLSGDRSWQDFRHGFQAVLGSPPAMILLTTDGFTNSFASDEECLEATSEILRRCRGKQAAEIEADLAPWVEEISREGSGDDVTVGLIIRADLLQDGGTQIESELVVLEGESS